MEKGRIIYLNGVTSTGKTSITRALQDREDLFFYALSNDLFEETVGERYLRADYWTHLAEAIRMMYHTAKLFSDMGKHVIIDGMILEKEEFRPHYQQIQEIFADNPLSVVEVYCPLEICRERNIRRGNRGEMQSHYQHQYMAKDVTHALRVNTHEQSAKECADEIVRALFSKITL
jgi:adenylylsulfate kinase/chloramphenicol 3-O phosphotransferase